ncbi:type II restriction enzyme [uncultured Methanolobus sp.]|uniref:type II restriction enzyme n=1 Tax=uncultured Methanolobus sp. TaxID=218300 RepID=UPI0029C624A5|nr:hypothetical protein [uncultured Methanolobus sp.]
MTQKTLNDIAWEQIFVKYDVINKIANDGFFEIKSKQINEFRESRLMAKFDHYINLPKTFRDNNLSILPISRSAYVIGQFQTHNPVSYQDIEPLPVDPLNFESINHTNLYSESSSLLYAYNSGIINNLVEEDVALTLNGRMSSDKFKFDIRNSINDSSFSVDVENAQIEIDAGFESDSHLILVEAKNTQVDDFLIRQIYYPYRLWSDKVNKDILNVFMTYSNDIFSFFVYEFKKENEYNSLNLIKQVDYLVAEEYIGLDDVIELYENTDVLPEPKNIPFPQADKFERIIDLLGLLYENNLTREDITSNYEFDVRQTSYYTSAGIYLGLINKYYNRKDKELIYCLTDLGKNIMKKNYQQKYLSIIQIILEHDIFNYVFETSLDNGDVPSVPEIIELMSDKKLDERYVHTTIKRRAQTIRGWINWIFKLTRTKYD